MISSDRFTIGPASSDVTHDDPDRGSLRNITRAGVTSSGTAFGVGGSARVRAAAAAHQRAAHLITTGAPIDIDFTLHQLFNTSSS
jgi:hypothetical protein